MFRTPRRGYPGTLYSNPLPSPPLILACKVSEHAVRKRSAGSGYQVAGWDAVVRIRRKPYYVLELVCPAAKSGPGG